MNHRLLLLFAAGAALCSCPAVVSDPGSLRFECAADPDCMGGYRCREGICVKVDDPVDAGVGDALHPDGAGTDPACRGVECPAHETCVPVDDGGHRCLCAEVECPSGASCVADEGNPGGVPICCSRGLHNCGGDCVDQESAVDHCGACGERCASGESCTQGSCRCGTGGGCDPLSQDCCGGVCRAVESDPEHCGALGTGEGCDTACAGSQPCVGGRCSCDVTSDCVEGEVCCSRTYCADLESSRSNCGACGVECRTGEVCQARTCVCAPEGCNDDDACTQDLCGADERCVYRTLDQDRDGWCDHRCLDAESGRVGDCQDGDCNDELGTGGGINPGRPELCNGVDDDCNPATADGADEDWLGTACDGDDADACADGQWRCTAGSQVCDDPPDDTLDICNGLDDDCRPGTLDGVHECPGRCCGVPPGCRSCCSAVDCGWGETCGDDFTCRCGETPGCGVGQECCDGTCLDVLTDWEHCGPVGTGVGCEVSCTGPDQPCTDGFCRCTGDGDCGGRTCCDNTYCADTQSDPTNCGICHQVCRPGELCHEGSCTCDDCDDGDPCTLGTCCRGGGCAEEQDRCSYHTRDADSDGYCDLQCPDSQSGQNGDCLDGDCDDDPATGVAVHPGAQELCNGIDDDCRPDTPDWNECPGLCCGNPPSCRQCCENEDCGEGAWLCTSQLRCECTGQVACDEPPAYCREESECCLPGDCGAGEWQCTATHTCSCSDGVVCSGHCYLGGNCCADDGCGQPTPHCDLSRHFCVCEGWGVDCDGTCFQGDCCASEECGHGGAWTCGDHHCSCEAAIHCPDDGVCAAEGSGFCCGDNDCGPGDWSCENNQCICAGKVCGDACYGGGVCCGGDEATVCGPGDWSCDGDHHCACPSQKICDLGGGQLHCVPPAPSEVLCCPGAEAVDCGSGQWECLGSFICDCSLGSCNDGYCRSPSECCVDNHCLGNNEHCEDHQCVCNNPVGCPQGCCGLGESWTCSRAGSCQCPSGRVCYDSLCLTEALGDDCCYQKSDCGSGDWDCHSSTRSCECATRYCQDFYCLWPSQNCCPETVDSDCSDGESCTNHRCTL